MTSITVLLALGALLIFGGHVLRGFSAAMMLGIVIGTYSSIYVSASMLITLGLRAEPPKAKGGPGKRSGPQNESFDGAQV
jgi:preprotein translocase subunit SecF